MCTDIFVARPMQSTNDAPCDYVIKVLRANCESDPVLVDTINREATAGRQLSHSHIISILAAHTRSFPYYVVMPRLEGATVRHAIDAVGPLVIPQSLWIARQVAEALAEMHRCCLLHCDVKPSNLFVTEAGHATLFDLGFATPWDRCATAPSVELRGTLAYIAPEMLTSTTAVGPWSDVYSLGVTLFEMLTGRLPFTQGSPARMAESHLREIPPSPRTFVPQLPRSVARLLRRMMAKDPSRRPTDDLVDTLMRLEIETFGLRSS
jgi:serine/threonine-protein kinase